MPPDIPSKALKRRNEDGEIYNEALERLGPDLAEGAHQLQSLLGAEIEKDDGGPQGERGGEL